MLYRTINISETSDNILFTVGLKHYNMNEIQLNFQDNKDGHLILLCYLIDYILDDRPKIKDNDTIPYGLWLLKFCMTSDFFNIFELDELFETWIEGADNAVYYFEQQKALCIEEGTSFSLPLFTQNLAVSSGVLEGTVVQGIRYNEPGHMSGWYLTSPLYDGNIKNMMVIPLQNLVVKRKDLLQFLALPPGYTFEITEDNNCYIQQAPIDITDN